MLELQTQIKALLKWNTVVKETRLETEFEHAEQENHRHERKIKRKWKQEIDMVEKLSKWMPA